MTRPDENRRPETRPIETAQDRLRAELLISALYDLVPLAEVESVIIRDNLATTIPARQQFALRTIRSLLEDGLMQIGDLPYPGEKFAGWDLSIDAAMQRVHDLFVRHYDERALWDLTIWLGLTPAGERQAHKLKGDAAD
ncbi:hypothetical protein I546_5294 [Mycobacterium kansasii 732]|uniref:Uncharacterized protein n=2 Tax=Mycobacterium TaxID=1763 RepID=A0A498QYT5_9MYCO|nr:MULTISPECIES: hypothetical protein [Mycobacterium]EUA07642.1 hypothetical protein I546_5294 [Mycobacterium kansasii 732]KZS62254.1 hypothetical protein A4G27_08905 [Mycobacterium kansasii]EUA17785.1 hypothetical protein I545_3273 [Mycobacterium kansasii 662]VBA30668.1 hypothetical protein LAUMK35_04806 [Mycobacterium pseudokansasii]VBA54553.1 hypothetical protein LAUMK142_04708 [Mycobacterium pseudokansasii]